MNLSPRQREILALLAEGRRTKQAAGDLGISYGTAKEHIREALLKLNARTSEHAVAIAVRQGVI